MVLLVTMKNTIKIIYSKELKNQEYTRLIIQEDSEYKNISVWGVDTNGLYWFLVSSQTFAGAKKESNRWIKEHNS